MRPEPERAWPSEHVASASQGAEPDAASLAMSSYAAGDEQAFADLYAALAPRLYRFCVCLIGRAEAADLLQEVFLKIHRAREAFVAGGNVIAWSFAIARTTCIDRARLRQRRREDSARQSQLELHGVGVVGSPEQAALGVALEHVVSEELLKLPESLRSAYALVKVEGMSSAEAAAVLGITSSAAKDRVHRANAALRAALEAAGWGEQYG